MSLEPVDAEPALKRYLADSQTEHHSLVSGVGGNTSRAGPLWAGAGVTVFTTHYRRIVNSTY